MTKERRTVSIEPETEQYLSSDGVNASQLVNKLVKNHVATGGDTRAMLELREEQLQSDVNELKSQLESKKDDLEQVRTRLEDQHDEREEILDEARNTLRNTPLEPDNPAVQYWAGEADMDVETFIDTISDGGT